MSRGEIHRAQVDRCGPVRVVVVVDDVGPSHHHALEEDLHVAIGGRGVVSPQTRSPLHSDDDPGHALPAGAAVLVDAGLVVALADAGVLGVALDAGLTALGAVLPQTSLQDVMADGCAQVDPRRGFRGEQLMKRVQRVGDYVWVLGQGAQPILVGRWIFVSGEEKVRFRGVTSLYFGEPGEKRVA